MHDLASPPPLHSAGNDWVASHCRGRNLDRTSLRLMSEVKEGGWVLRMQCKRKTREKTGLSLHRPCLLASSTMAELVGHHASSEATEVNIEVRGGRRILGGVRFELIGLWPSSKPRTYPEMQCTDDETKSKNGDEKAKQIANYRA